MKLSYTILLLAFILVVDGSSAKADTFANTGSMTTPRVCHTATTLLNGKVLVTGGDRLVSAELYVQANESWTPTGQMSEARAAHTATLLSNGKVLVTGGGNDNGTLTSTELYDPATGTWSQTGSLRAARYNHSATMLKNGEVLLTGGWDSKLGISSVELYDPTTGRWKSAAKMKDARFAHQSTLLSDGSVLVTGGYGKSIGEFLSSAELYNPATNKWKSVKELGIARAEHTATLLPDGNVLVTGGGSNGERLASAEIYDPASGKWRATGPLKAARTHHTATLLANGKVLVVGGWNGNVISTGELYNPTPGNWNAAGSMLTARHMHAATLVDGGKVLVAGGQNSGRSLTGAELFEPSINNSIVQREPNEDVAPSQIQLPRPEAAPIPQVAVSNIDPLDLLAQEGSNMIAWVTSPLDVDIPDNFRANISLLREDLLDGHANGSASPEIYQSAVVLCDNLMACIDKKEKQQIDAKLRVAQAKQRSPLSNQALEARRNYLMSWPQYHREVRQREVLAEEKGDNTEVKASELELAWIETAGTLRKALDVKYSAYRAALRKK